MWCQPILLCQSRKLLNISTADCPSVAPGIAQKTAVYSPAFNRRLRVVGVRRVELLHLGLKFPLPIL